MFHIKPILIFAALAFVFIGCSSEPTIKKGDKLIVQEKLEHEEAETVWDDPSYSDAFNTDIPQGTVLQVVVTPTTGQRSIEVIPVEVNGSKDEETITNFFVPEPIRNKDGFKSYSFSLKKEYLGKQIKKEE